MQRIDIAPLQAAVQAKQRAAVLYPTRHCLESTGHAHQTTSFPGQNSLPPSFGFNLVILQPRMPTCMWHFDSILFCLRLTPSTEANLFFHLELALYIAKSLSNSRGKGPRQFVSEERGGVKIHPLSPRMHFASGDGDTKGVRGQRRGASAARRSAGGRRALQKAMARPPPHLRRSC